MKKNYLEHFIKNSVFFLFLLSPVLELLDGFLILTLHFPYFGPLISALFLLLPLFLILYLPSEKGHLFLCFFVFILTHMFLRLTRINISAEAILFELKYTSRSILIMLSVILFINTLHIKKAGYLFKRYFLIQWIVITIAIVLHATLGFGGVKYGYSGLVRPGYNSYYESGNQLAFFYTTSWWVVASLTLGSLQSGRLRLFLQTIITFLTLTILFAIGTKTGVALTILMIVFFLLKKLYDASRIIFAFTAITAVASTIFLFINFELCINFVADVFFKYSSRSDRLAQSINTYGILTALVSQRNYFVSHALEAISNYNIKDLFIGATFYTYKKAVGTHLDTRDIRMAEVDPIDLLGGVGILGVLTVYLPILWIFIQLIKKRKHAVRTSEFLGNSNLPISILGVLLIGVLSSSMSGHVTIGPSPMMCLGLTLAMAWHLIRAGSSDSLFLSKIV
ncbi:MAG: hypothetical protein E3K32_13530 [wastewater metagenome]|nr:hypothetical protein [Candidatus Loosdrechtia aerotolerans]